MEPSPLLARWGRVSDSARPAVLDASGTHSYAQVDARSRALAHSLLGPQRSLAGARVALLVEPGAAFVEALYAVFRAGGCAVVLSPLHPPAETAYFLEDARITAVFASDALRTKLGHLPAGVRLLPVDALRDHVPPAHFHLPAPVASDPALQVYTSGTTGKPKGAVLTHQNLGAQQAALGEAWGMGEEDVLLHVLPLHHVHGLSIALLNVLGAGGAARMLPGFDAAAVWEALGESTVFMAVPTVYAKLLEAYDAADAETRARWREHAWALRLATSGSAALPVSLGERWRVLTGKLPLERYGMTEVGVALSNPLEGERRPGHVGLPLPGVQVRVVGEDGQDADTGELWVAGESVFPGYWQREEESRKAFTEHAGVRWFRTGDTVARGEGGALRILGRTSVDILKSGGYKLSALELEELMREHPAVAEAAVVGLPDEVWGERVVACVVARPGRAGELTEDAVRTWAKERVAAYKVPRHVLVFDALPRNAMGKVVKPQLLTVVRERVTVQTR